MADRTVEGRVIFAGTSNGIAGLNIVAVDFDPFFLEDRLGSASTDANGNFKITYAQSRYSEWLPERKPDIVGKNLFSIPPLSPSSFSAL